MLGCKLKKFSELDEEKFQQITALEKECREHDGGGAALYLDTDAAGGMEMDCFYFIYEKGETAAFLSLFVVDEENVEINALTRPQSRRKGYFKKLFKAAMKELRKSGIKNIRFAADGGTERLKETAEAAAKCVNAVYEYSEYVLVFDKTAEQTYYSNGICFAAPEAEFTMKTASSLFPGENTGTQWFYGWQEGEERQLYNFADESGRRIGICSVYRSGKSACIYNFGIAKEYQGKGFGKRALMLLLGELSKDCDKIILQVSSKNSTAYSLYTKNGFKTQEERDYYTLTQHKCLGMEDYYEL